LIPFLKDNNDVVKLSTYRGKAKNYNADGGFLFKTSPIRNGKEFAWSRGLGMELSPLKTRSSRKKLAQTSTLLLSLCHPITELGPLRALKSLARAK
jgi:hypothetical protein